MPAVSIIIPVFNTHEFLRTCLGSVLGQTLRDIEVICVDDGSTDGSTDILREIADRDARVRLVFHAENKGVSAARNAGLAIATGDYVGFVDSDDTVCETYFASLYESCRANKADMAKGIYFSADAAVHAEQHAYNEKVVADKYAFTINFTTAVYRREMLVKNEIMFPEDTRNGEDIVFLIKAVHFANTVTSVPEAKYIYREREDSASRRKITCDVIRNVLKSAEHVADFIASVTMPTGGREIVFYHTAVYILHKVQSYTAMLPEEIKGRVLDFIARYSSGGFAPKTQHSIAERFERLMAIYGLLQQDGYGPRQRLVGLYAAACKFSVMYYIGSLSAGGAERQCAALAVEMARRGYCVILVNDKPISEKSSHYQYILERSGVFFLCYDDKNFMCKGLKIIKEKKKEGFYREIQASYPFRNCIVHLSGLINTFHPDILHCYLDGPNVIGGCAAIITDTPALLSFRNINPEEAGYEWTAGCAPVYRQIVHHPLLSFEANSHVGLESYASWLDIPTERIAYSPNGIDPKRFSLGEAGALRDTLGIRQEAPVLVTLSRFHWTKRPEDMLDIFARVHDVLPEARYIIAGQEMCNGDEMGNLVRERGLQDVVHLLGPQKDVSPILAAGNVFLLPSANEGMSNAIMEAMLHGLPVVVTDVGAASDLVRNNVDGFLHTVGDVKSMANDIIRLFSGRAMAYDMGKNGKERIMGEFSLDALVDRESALYFNIMKG